MCLIKNLKIKSVIIIVHILWGQLCLRQCIQMLLCSGAIRMVTSQIRAKYSQCPSKESACLLRLALRPGRFSKVVQDHCGI